MDLNSKKYQMLKELYVSFAENEVKPLATELDEEERFPYETVEKMAKAGMMGIPYPKEYGGEGGDTVGYIMAVEELSRVCGTTGVILSAHTSLGSWPIYQYGNEEQKQKFLRPLASGEKLGAFGLTEPNAGTDASGQQTTAVLDGDEYILNGSKIFITNAIAGDIYVVMAMTDKSKGNKGISAFIVEKGTPGFSFGVKEKKMGIRGSATSELIFEDCRIPKENLLGKEGQGFKIAMGTLEVGRIGVAALALGIAQGALDEAVKYTKQRVQFGKPIAKFQNTQFTIADMETKVCAARGLVYDAAQKRDAGMRVAQESAMAKYYASEIANEVAYKALQLHGGYGFIKDYEIERMYRDARIVSIYEGTSEVQKMVISSNVLK